MPERTTRFLSASSAARGRDTPATSKREPGARPPSAAQSFSQCGLAPACIVGHVTLRSAPAAATLRSESAAATLATLMRVVRETTLMVKVTRTGCRFPFLECHGIARPKVNACPPPSGFELYPKTPGRDLGTVYGISGKLHGKLAARGSCFRYSDASSECWRVPFRSAPGKGRRGSCFPRWPSHGPGQGKARQGKARQVEKSRTRRVRSSRHSPPGRSPRETHGETRLRARALPLGPTRAAAASRVRCG